MQRNVAARHAGEKLLLLATFLLFAFPARADATRTVVLLASGLTLDDLRADGPLPAVRELAEAGGVGLMNTAVSGAPTEAAAYLSVGASERMAAPPSLADAAWEVASTSDPAAAGAYRRRFGAAPPSADMVHLGLPALLRAQPSDSRAVQVGALGDALRGAGLRAVTVGGWRAALATLDRRGVVPADAPGADVTVMVADGPAALDALARSVLPAVRSGAARVLVAVPYPPRAPGGGWARLGFVVAAGPGVPAGSLLTSPTTRTPGLSANVDLAPTVLTWHRAGPLPNAAGRPLRAEPSADPWGAVAALDRQVVATTAAAIPVSAGYATFAIGSVLASALLLWRGRARAGALRAARLALLLSAAALTAFLPVGVIAPVSPWGYGGCLVAVSAALVGVAYLLARWLCVPTAAVLFLVGTLAVCVDAVFGSPLVSRALLSGFYLAGIRFYGVGNEYMGLAIGSALAGPLLLPSRAARRTAALVLWPWTLLAVGLPWWGANAGGAFAAGATFTAAVLASRTPLLRARHVAAAFAAGFVAVALLALLDRLRPGDARSHVGAAVAAGQVRGVSALAEIALRKVAMNVRLTLTPWALAAIAGLIPTWVLLARGPLADRARESLARRPGLRQVALPAALWGGLAALVFNDSGMVAALLLLAPPTVALIDAMLADVVS
jgi:hypothetical protein